MKISVIGGGGTRTPILVKGLLGLEKELNLEEICLYDLDEERLSLMNLVLEHMREPESRTKLRTSLDFKEAITGSSFVFLAIRVGKEEMRILDERIPLKHGLIGQETVGAGGAAMAVRTIPKVLEMAEAIREECPQAWVINFTNPSGIVTEALLNCSPLEKVVGICDAPANIKLVFSKFMQFKEEEVFLDYFGLNHLGWVKGIRVRGEDYLPKIMKYLPMFPQIENYIRFPAAFILKIGMIPNPYLYYYYFPEEALREMQREPRTRGEEVQEMNEALFSSLQAGNRDPLQVYQEYLGRRESGYGAGALQEGLNLEEGEGYIKVSLGTIRGLLGYKVGNPVVNVRNSSAIPGMEGKDVVEIPVEFSSGTLKPISSGPVPEDCLNLMRAVKRYEKKLVEAAVARSLEGVIEALSLNPLVNSHEAARALVRDFQGEQGEYWAYLR